MTTGESLGRVSQQRRGLFVRLMRATASPFVKLYQVYKEANDWWKSVKPW
jgi:hypothetical protein